MLFCWGLPETAQSGSVWLVTSAFGPALFTLNACFTLAWFEQCLFGCIGFMIFSCLDGAVLVHKYDVAGMEKHLHHASLLLSLFMKLSTCDRHSRLLVGRYTRCMRLKQHPCQNSEWQSGARPHLRLQLQRRSPPSAHLHGELGEHSAIISMFAVCARWSQSFGWRVKSCWS